MKTSNNKNKTGLYALGSLYPEVTGGMEVFNYYFLNYQLNRENGAIYYLGSARTANMNGYFVPLRRIWPSRIFYPVSFFWAVWKLRKKIDFAYISYAEQSWIISYSQSLILRLFRKPYIITIHWGKEPEWKFPYPFVSFFSHAHAVIGVSEPICVAFKKAIPQQEFLYIPPLIPFQHSPKSKTEIRTQWGYSQGDKILLFVGALKGMKNPDMIVEAFHAIGPDFLNEHHIKMVFAGSGEMENELKESVEKYHLEKYIRLVGLVSRENVPDYYKAADGYIISSDYEGTSVSLLEAMFNRSAIIGSDAPGINRMLVHEYSALLYDTKSVDQLAGAIKRIFSDPALADRLSENAFAEFNKKYAYESMMEKYRAVFSSVLS